MAGALSIPASRVKQSKKQTMMKKNRWCTYSSWHETSLIPVQLVKTTHLTSIHNNTTTHQSGVGGCDESNDGSSINWKLLPHNKRWKYPNFFTLIQLHVWTGMHVQFHQWRCMAIIFGGIRLNIVKVLTAWSKSEKKIIVYRIFKQSYSTWLNSFVLEFE